MNNKANIYSKILLLQLIILFLMPGLGQMNSAWGIITYAIFGILSVILVALYIKNEPFQFSLCNKLVLLFFVICFISGIYGCCKGNSLANFIRGLLPFCWYIYIIIFSSKRERSSYSRIVLGFALVACAYALRIIIYYIVFVLLGESSRVTLNLSVATSPITMVGVIIFIYFYLFYSRKFSGLYLGGMALCYLAMSLTITKSMTVANVLGIVIFAILVLIIRLKIKDKNFGISSFFKKLLIIVGILVIVTGVIYMTTNMAQRWESAAEAVATNEMDGSVAPRLVEYKVAYENWKESPVLGKGLGYTWHSDKLPYADGIIFMHNIIAYWLMDYGVVGIAFLIVVIIAIIGCFIKIVKNANANNYVEWGLATLTFTILVMMFVYANFFAVFRNIDFSIICAICISILVGISRLEKE